MKIRGCDQHVLKMMVGSHTWHYPGCMIHGVFLTLCRVLSLGIFPCKLNSSIV